MGLGRALAAAVHLGCVLGTGLAGTFGPGPGGLIPDNNPAGFTSTISVPASGATIASFESVTIVFGNPNHSWVGDLHAELRSPGGAVVHLFSRVGSTAQNLFGDDSDLGGTYVFANAAHPASIADAAAGAGQRERVPEGTYARSTNPIPGGAPAGQVFTDFSALVGGPVSGNWQLFVSDTVEGDAGGIVSWSIQMTPFLVVTNTQDGAPAPAGSLRAVVAAATAIGGGTEVRFAPEVTGTITLSQGAIAVSSSIAIRGPGANRLAVSGNNASRVLTIGTTGPVVLSDITIQDGRASGGTGNSGGAIQANSGARLSLERCIVRNSSVTANTSAQGGGISLGGSGAELHLTDCTFSGNSASAATAGMGGAVYCASGPATVTNCTFAGNTAAAGTVGYGAALYSGAGATIRNSTFTANTSSGVGTATVYASATAVTLGNTIIAGNQGAQTGASGASFFTEGHNLIGDSSTGFVDGVNGDRIGIDPRLGPLADNGGPTPTCGLLSDSPAIDAGATGVSADQRGLPRGNDGDCDGSGAADVGAFEFNAGRGLNFDGVSNFAGPASDAVWALASGFTIEAWVTADSFSDPTGTTRFVSTRSGTNAGWGFGQTGGKLIFTTFGRRDFTTTSVVLAPRVRTHVAVVFDSAFAAHFYVNGQPIQTIADTLPAVGAATLAIGRNPSTADRQSFDGVMEEVRIWNSVRTDAEIAANYQRRIQGPEAGLLAVWPLDDGAGGVARELAGNRQAAINGTVVWMGSACATCPADLNGDFEVTLADLAQLLGHFGASGAGREDGDIDGDGSVALSDLSVLLSEFGSQCP
ncbi:MAG: hypothetical protein AMXMBFR47_37260 [Planctomycetota bacterium]